MFSWIDPETYAPFEPVSRSLRIEGESTSVRLERIYWNVLEEIVDLEEHSKHGIRPPRCRGYRIRVNDERIVVHKEVVTGGEVLELAGLRPPERYCLRLRLRGERPRLIGHDTQVDLTLPGTERFLADELRPIPVKVNEHEVIVEGPKTTGLAIKEAAVKAGLIQLDFVLSIELPNGRTKIIGDNDVIFLEEGACFVAVAPDDNS